MLVLLKISNINLILDNNKKLINCQELFITPGKCTQTLTKTTNQQIIIKRQAKAKISL